MPKEKVYKGGTFAELLKQWSIDHIPETTSVTKSSSKKEESNK